MNHQVEGFGRPRGIPSAPHAAAQPRGRKLSYDERRERLERWIERAIARLDQLDAVGEEQEPEADVEPWLGWSARFPGDPDEGEPDYTILSRAYSDDLELDCADDEDGADAEPCCEDEGAQCDEEGIGFADWEARAALAASVARRDLQEREAAYA